MVEFDHNIYIYNYELSHPLYMIFTFQTPFIGDVTLPMFDYYRGYWGWKSCYFLYIGIYRQTLPTLEDFKKCQPGLINLTLFRWISLGCCNFNTIFFTNWKINPQLSSGIQPNMAMENLLLSSMMLPFFLYPKSSGIFQPAMFDYQKAILN